jgi:hypothetical protein
MPMHVSLGPQVSSRFVLCCIKNTDKTRYDVFLREYERAHRTYRVQRKRAGTQGRGRGRSVKDLKIGAVDELLIGVSVVRDKDKRGKPPVGILLSFETLHFIMTNNNSIFLISSCHLMTFRYSTYLGYSSDHTGP